MPATLINPLRLDPSGTSLLRRQFTADMRRRFDSFRSSVYWLLVDPNRKPDDQFNSKSDSMLLPFMFGPVREWPLESFNRWVTNKINEIILGYHSVTHHPEQGHTWLWAYLLAAYIAGISRSYHEVEGYKMGPSPEYQRGARETFLSDVMQSHSRYLSLTHYKAEQDLKAIGSYLTATATKIFSDRMARGDSPTSAANAISQQVNKVLEKRAEPLVESYLVSASAEGQLSGAEALGIDKVTPEIEYLLGFTTKGDMKVCPKCKKLDGRTYTPRKARGVIPVHPKCRCRWTLVKRK